MNKSKLRITLISQDFYPMKGGIASYLMQTYEKYFSNQNFEVIVPEKIGCDAEYGDLPFKVYREEFYPFELGSENRKRANCRMLNILEKNESDIVLFGYLRSHPEIGELYKEINSKSKFGIFTHAKEVFFDASIVEINHNINKSHKGYLKEELIFYTHILWKADYVFSVSNFTKKLLISQGINRPINVVYPSVKQLSGVKKNNEENITILSVGRLIDRKGQCDLVESIARLSVKIPNLNCIIVGEGPNKDKIEDKVKSLKLCDKISLVHDVKREELNKLYRLADIFVLPTRFIPPNDIEGFGIVFIEAGAYSLPVIGGMGGGVDEAIVNGETGFLINSNSFGDLDSKLALLCENASLRRKLGETGRLRAVNEFNMNYSNDLIELFSNSNKYES
ncbi:MAG: glycosyltransferase family 4 protein [Candidatus Nanoarchaeia archaeon]